MLTPLPPPHACLVPPCPVTSSIRPPPPQVRPWFFTREDFKTAANMFTQEDFTPQHRQDTTKLLQVGESGQGWLVGAEAGVGRRCPVLIWMTLVGFMQC